MLGKLIKHEFKGTYKIFGLLFSALILLTLLSRFCIYIPFDNMIYDFLTGFINIAYMISVFCITLACTVIVMLRFNRNMLKDEGYLTHTLPVKVWQHIVAKVLTYTVWIIASIIMMLFSLFLYFVGTDEFDVVIDFVNSAMEAIEAYPFLITTGIFTLVVCIIQVMVSLLAYMSALSLGQIFRKHKVAGAVFFYFVLNNVMSSMASGIMMLMPDFVDDINDMETKMEEANTIAQIAEIACDIMNVLMLISLVLLIINAVVYFFITNYMLSKKLDLE